MEKRFAKILRTAKIDVSDLIFPTKNGVLGADF
jgi:hypothetical protein